MITRVPSLGRLLSATLLLVAAGLAQAQVKVADPWVRGTVPGQKATGAFMQITSDEPMTLVGAESDLTPVTEVHEMRMVGDVMRMRQVEGVELEPGMPLILEPGGYHVMFMNLGGPVEVGQSVSLTLHFRRADGSRHSVAVQAPVRPLTAGRGAAMKHGQGHGGHQGHGAGGMGGKAN
jgi:copper(I)-binding protein